MGGQTQNPYKTGMAPCGSSSGSAVAVAANLTAVAIGTETLGSLVCPASHSGIVTLKPTAGLVSQKGIIPVAHSFDTAGPMTRTITDLAILLGAIDNRKVDYTQFLKPNALAGKRIAVASNVQSEQLGVSTLFNQAIADLKRRGAIIIQSCSFDYERPYSQFYSVALTEFRAGINQHLNSTKVTGAENLDALVKRNEKLRDQELDLFGQEIFTDAQTAAKPDEKSYQQTLTNRPENERRSSGY